MQTRTMLTGALAALIATMVFAADVPTRKDTVLVSVTATVTGIDLKERRLTLKNEAGETRTFVVGPEVKRLNEVKVGDAVSIGYYVSVALELREPTAEEKEHPLAAEEVAARATGNTAPAGVVTRQLRAVMTVSAIDRAHGTVTLKGPLGRTITERVEDEAQLAKLQVGQTLVVTFTEDIAISLEPAKAPAPK